MAGMWPYNLPGAADYRIPEEVNGTRKFEMSSIYQSLKVAFMGSIFLAATASFAGAQTTAANAGAGTVNTSSISQAQIDEIIRKFSAKEGQFRRALNQYAFKRDALIQEIGMGGQVVGEYRRVSDFTFDDSGNRFEKINFFPLATLQSISMTPEDLDDLGGVNPFALEAGKIGLYNFKYVGKERIDELDLYVFDVAPKVMPNPSKTKDRVFVGRIWVDDQDLQIVKAKGKAGPETKQNKFAVVETYREQIDGRFWFPTYAYADDDLIFDNGLSVRIRMQVKYTNYVVGRGKVTITELEEVKPETNPNDPSAKPRATGPIESGDLNGKATDLPQPYYPEEARKAKVTGQVKLRVLVDETGRVLSVDIISGHKMLVMSAIEAARKARFKPTLVGDTAVKITGTLTYDFKE
jgi:TonB family protein